MTTRVYSSLNVAMVKHLKHVLENRGIECEIRGEFRSVAMGEIPLSEAWTELWVAAERADDARELIENGAPEGRTETSWICGCREQIEAQFTECWSCGAARPVPAGDAAR